MARMLRKTREFRWLVKCPCCSPDGTSQRGAGRCASGRAGQKSGDGSGRRRMIERTLNRASVFTEAAAAATHDPAGNPTVTVRGSFEQDSYRQTNTIHLAMPAALQLYLDLKDALSL